MSFHIQLTAGSGTPIYRQIIEQVRLGVATATLVPGDAMPSVRTLAEQNVVNPNTVVKAYAELVRDGVLESQHGKGFFVAAKRQVYSRAERLRRFHQALDAFVHEAIFLDFSPDTIRKAVDKKLDELDLPLQRAGEEP
ncbi:MAG TPA: GntR family transcriptional regulator [Gemmataceae bacterium]|nr:GntR family transcriptional regulator [Gemmataceae bacterium]